MKTTIFFLIAFVFFINNISAQTPPSGITVAGGNGAGGAANQLSYPSGVFVDLNGNIYIGDAGNSRVQKWAPNATEGITVAGGNGKGNAANQLGSPSSLFVDANGNIYVLDNLFTQDDITSRVQKWAPNATEGVTVAGGNGRGYLANQLNNPKGIWVDNEGNVYVADHDNGRVQKWAPNATEGTFLSEIYGTPPNSLFILPSDIFIDNSGNYYIVDGNHRIIKWSSNLGTVAVIAGGEYGGGAAQFRFPQAVFVDKFGNVYVADDGNNRIQMWAPNATEGKTVAVGLNRPWDVFVDRDGYIYVADPGNHRIQKFPPIETFQPIDLTTPLRFGGGLSTLHVGTSYNLTASLKNSGNTTWAGDIYLKVNNGTPTLLAANQTIAAGATINLNGNFLPQMEQIGSNVPIELLTKQGSGNFETVEAGDGTVNPIVVNIEQLQVQTSP
ncbi:MAG: hypothetical protein KKG00_05800, partial [Bacteroidetes bacterium]|nr:hypothetical protein [Bacteroidota bacterium]